MSDARNSHQYLKYPFSAEDKSTDLSFVVLAIFCSMSPMFRLSC